MKLEVLLIIVQILFYITVGTIAVLTYLSAKKGLLNTINTEYHKRIFDKIESLSEELLSEFDPKSENYWCKKGDHLTGPLDEIHETYKKNKKEILKRKEFSTVVPTPDSYERLQRIILRIKSDPFLPDSIRDNILENLETRVQLIHEISWNEIKRYTNELALGKLGDDFEVNSATVHNRINEKMYEMNCGISQVEEQIHNIRLFIKDYMKQFNPIKNKLT